jgi:type-2 restriction enzyme hgiDI
MSQDKPMLFGLNNSNRDFSNKDDWGKNVFNNAFPASLLCYMFSKNIDPVYLSVDKTTDTILHSKISTQKVFGKSPLDNDLFFAFEHQFSPYETLVSSSLPRIDLVVSQTKDNLMDDALRGIEIKLTAVPDNSTANASKKDQSAEIVVRPDTIVYIALSIARNFITNKTTLGKYLLETGEKIQDWNEPTEIAPVLSDIINSLKSLLRDTADEQEPLLLQPIWRTTGKSLQLENNCLDAFIWSDYAMARLFIDNSDNNGSYRITRSARSTVWLFKMLYDYVKHGKINHTATIRNINFGSQTDKAFAVSGIKTINYLRSKELSKPRITKEELKNIILGGGYKMLSPERRFDAAIMSSASIFEGNNYGQ